MAAMAESKTSDDLSKVGFDLLAMKLGQKPNPNAPPERPAEVHTPPQTPEDTSTPPVVDVTVTKTDAGKAQKGYDLVAQCLRDTVKEFVNYPNTTMKKITNPKSGFRTTIRLVNKLKKARKEVEQYFDKSPLMTTATLEWPKELTRKGDDIRIAFRDLVDQFGKDAGLSGKQLDDPKVRAAAVFGATTLMEMYDGEASGFYGTETFDPRYLYDWTHKKSNREKVLGRVTTAALPTILKALRAYFAGKAAAGLVSDTLGGLSTVMKYINNIVPTGTAGFTLKTGLGLATGWWTGFITTVLDWVTKLFNSQFLKKFSAAGFRDASLMFVHELIRDVVVHAMLDGNLILTEYIVFWRAGIQFVLVLASALIPVFIQRRYNLPMESQRRVFGASNALDMTRPDGIRVTNQDVTFRARRAEKTLKELHKQMARYAISQSQSLARNVTSWFLTLITPRDFDSFALQIIGYSLFKEIIFMTAEQPKSEDDGSPTDPEEMVAVSYDGENRLINTKNGTGSIDMRWLPGRKTDDHWAKELEKWRSALHEKLGRGTSEKGLNNAIATDGSSWGDSLWDQVKHLGNLARPGVLGEDTSTFYEEGIVNFGMQLYRVLWADKTSSKESSSADKVKNLLEFNTDIVPCLFLDTGNEGTSCTFIAKPLAGAGARIAEWFGRDPKSIRELLRQYVKARNRYVRMSNSSAKELQAEADIQTVAKTAKELGPDVLDMHRHPEKLGNLHKKWPKSLKDIPVTVKGSNLTVTGRELKTLADAKKRMDDQNATAADVNDAYKDIEDNYFKEKLGQRGLIVAQRVEIGRNMVATRNSGEGLFLERGFNSTEFSALQYGDILNAVTSGNYRRRQMGAIIEGISTTETEAPVIQACLDFAERNNMLDTKEYLQKVALDQNVEGQERVTKEIERISGELEQLAKNVSYEPGGWVSSGKIDASLPFEETTENLGKAKQLLEDVTQLETQNKTLKDVVVENNSTTQIQWKKLKDVANVVSLLKTQQQNKLLDGFSKVVPILVKSQNKNTIYNDLVKKDIPDIEAVKKELEEVGKRLDIVPNVPAWNGVLNVKESWQSNLKLAQNTLQWMITGKKLNGAEVKKWIDLGKLNETRLEQEQMFRTFKGHTTLVSLPDFGAIKDFVTNVKRSYQHLLQFNTVQLKVLEHEEGILLVGQEIEQGKKDLEEAIAEFENAKEKKNAKEKENAKEKDINAARLKLKEVTLRVDKMFNTARQRVRDLEDYEEGLLTPAYDSIVQTIKGFSTAMDNSILAMSGGKARIDWTDWTNDPEGGKDFELDVGRNTVQDWLESPMWPNLNPLNQNAAGGGFQQIYQLPNGFQPNLALSIPLMGMSGVREKKQQSRL